MFQPTKLAVLMIGLVVASPWMLAQSTPAAPTPLPPAEKVESPTAAADPNGAPQPVDPRSFEIGAEDVLKILVWQSQEFSGLHVVRPDGKITLPLVGDVQAEGLTPNRLTAGSG